MSDAAGTDDAAGLVHRILLRRPGGRWAFWARAAGPGPHSRPPRDAAARLPAALPGRRIAEGAAAEPAKRSPSGSGPARRAVTDATAGLRGFLGGNRFHVPPPAPQSRTVLIRASSRTVSPTSPPPAREGSTRSWNDGHTGRPSGTQRFSEPSPEPSTRSDRADLRQDLRHRRVLPRRWPCRDRPSTSAAGRCLSAEQPGMYHRNGSSTTSGKRRNILRRPR